jgi:hypothetical protein
MPPRLRPPRRSWKKQDVEEICVHSLSVDLYGSVDAPLLPHVDSICDAVSGAGHTGLGFAGIGSRIVAVDPAPNMLAQSRCLAANRGVAIETVEALAEAIGHRLVASAGMFGGTRNREGLRRRVLHPCPHAAHHWPQATMTTQRQRPMSCSWVGATIITISALLQHGRTVPRLGSDGADDTPLQ